MRRSPLVGLLTLLLPVACVQDVNLGLSDTDTGVGENAGDGDSGSDGGSGSSNDGGPSEQPVCAGDAIQCVGCGWPREPRCSESGWVCDPVVCQPCKVDSECGDGELCEVEDFITGGGCIACPPIVAPFCAGGTVVNHHFGRQCQYATCDCPGGTSHVEGQGCVGAGGWLDIDPSTITFFALPIDSVRYAVSGLDPDARTCATIVWPLGALEDAVSRCGETEPYVVLTGDTDGPCGQWDYSGNAVTDSANGCYDFADFANVRVSGEPHLDLVDMEVTVTSTTYTGGIRISNRAYLDPPPVSFFLEFHSADAAYVQETDYGVRQTWADLSYNGVSSPIGPGCAVYECGMERQSCPLVHRTVRTLDEGAGEGSVALTWDGYVFIRPRGEEECVERQPAHPGTYQLQTCYGLETQTTMIGDGIVGMTCPSAEFDYPTAKAGVTVTR